MSIFPIGPGEQRRTTAAPGGTEQMAGDDGGHMIVKKVDDQIVSFYPAPARNCAHGRPRHSDAGPWKHQTVVAVNDLHSFIVVIKQASARGRKL
jgi:hypothetical protein